MTDTITPDQTDEATIRHAERQRCKADVCHLCASGDRPARNPEGKGWWHEGGVCASGGIWEREHREGLT